MIRTEVWSVSFGPTEDATADTRYACVETTVITGQKPAVTLGDLISYASVALCQDLTRLGFF